MLTHKFNLKNKVFLEMHKSCYSNSRKGLNRMCLDLLHYYSRNELYQEAGEIQEFMIQNNMKYSIEDYTPKTFDMFALYEVCEEAVSFELEYYDRMNSTGSQPDLWDDVIGNL